MEQQDDMLLKWVIENDYTFKKSDEAQFKAVFDAARKHFTDDELLDIMRNTYGHQSGNIFYPLKYFTTVITGEARAKAEKEKKRLEKQPQPQPITPTPITPEPEIITQLQEQGVIFYGYDKNDKPITSTYEEADKGVAEVKEMLRKLAIETESRVEKLAREMNEAEMEEFVFTI